MAGMKTLDNYDSHLEAEGVCPQKDKLHLSD